MAKKAKISRPVLYTLLVGVIAYAAVVLTEPDAPAHKTTHRTTTTSHTQMGDLTEADYTAHYARYIAKERNAFQPLIVPKKLVNAKAPPPNPLKGGGLALSGGTWTLTGISSLNGVKSALLENGTTHEIVFLKVGDLWNNLRVDAIENDAILFTDAQGKKTRLAFAENPVTATPGAGANAPAAATPSPTPGAGPLTVAPITPSPRLERERRQSK